MEGARGGEKSSLNFCRSSGVRKTRRVGEIRTARLPAPPFPPDFRAPQPSPRQSEVTSERTVVGYPPWVGPRRPCQHSEGLESWLIAIWIELTRATRSAARTSTFRAKFL